MEPRPSEKPLKSRGEDQTSSARPPERKRRFQIIKLEERIAPLRSDSIFVCNGHTHNKPCYR
jgi:hypothetical protein